MITFWHIAAVCCIPSSNPTARQREREILRLAAQVQANHAAFNSKKPGRWEAETKPPISKGRRALKDPPEIAD